MYFIIIFYPSFPRLFLRFHNHQTDAIKRTLLLLWMLLLLTDRKHGSDTDATLDHGVY